MSVIFVAHNFLGMCAKRKKIVTGLLMVEISIWEYIFCRVLEMLLFYKNGNNY